MLLNKKLLSKIVSTFIWVICSESMGECRYTPAALLNFCPSNRQTCFWCIFGTHVAMIKTTARQALHKTYAVTKCRPISNVSRTFFFLPGDSPRWINSLFSRHKSTELYIMIPVGSLYQAEFVFISTSILPQLRHHKGPVA